MTAATITTNKAIKITEDRLSANPKEQKFHTQINLKHPIPPLSIRISH